MEATPRSEERIPRSGPGDFVGPLLILIAGGAAYRFEIPAVAAFAGAFVLSLVQLVLFRRRHERLRRSARQWQRAASGYESHLVKMRDRLEVARARLRRGEGRIEAAERFEEKARQRLIEDDHQRSVARIVPTVMHELNNPLAIIGGSAELLESLPDHEREGRRDQVRRIARAARRCQALLQPFLHFARGSGTRRGVAAVSESVERVLALLSAEIEEEKVKLIVRLPDELPAVGLDPVVLDEVLLHLVSNALEAMSECRRPRLRISACVRDAVVELNLSDVGPGIPAEMREHIFEPFGSSRGEGRGLGLAVTAELLARSEASIRLEDVRPGCRATLYLPVA